MGKDAQSDIFFKLLHKFERAGVLDQVMLIGSWCLSFYRSTLGKAGKLPVLRTLDADFLIPSQRSLKREVDIPALLKEMGFVQTFYRSSGWVVYDHPELRVEFLIPETGRGRDSAHEVKKLHVNAQGLRYLNLLADHPRELFYEGLSVRVPEPAAFALQKLIISQRRQDKLKQQRDLDTAVALLDYVFSNSKELSKLKNILKDLPKGWGKTLKILAKKYYPRLEAHIPPARSSR